MRLTILLLSVALATVAAGQGTAVSGQAVLKESGQPLGFTTVSILSDNRQLLTNETGKFFLPGLEPGEVRLRFKRIGFQPTDTTLRLAANDTARLLIEMKRLVIQLPAMMVSGKCTNEAPLEPKPAILTELIDQVHQNAERLQLLARQKPFLMHVFRVNGLRNKDNKIVPTDVDTIIRGPLPVAPYQTKRVIRRDRSDEWVMGLPELPDFADTAFTNNHCFRYAGTTRFESDSAIQVDFEPVPWLDKDVDIEGSMFLRTDGYQLIGLVAKLNKVPPQFRMSGLEEVSVRAKFTELVTGIPVLDEWTLTSRFRKPTLPRVEVGQVFNLKWIDSTATKVDTLRLLPRLR
jgi:hypothetical protein